MRVETTAAGWPKQAAFLCIVLISLCCIASTESRAQGWPEIFDPLQLVTLHLELDPTDWETIQHDETLSIEVPAQFWTDGEAPILVSVRRKSADPLTEVPGYVKVALKIDINEYVAGQTWHDLKKLSLENGDDQDVVSEGLSWQLHTLASGSEGYDYPAGHGSWVTVHINGINTGVYVHAEQRDKQFLRNRDLYINGQTWLYKISDIGDVEIKVGEGDSPTYTQLCYAPFQSGGDACASPDQATFAEELNDLIEMRGMLTMAMVNNFVGNGDALFSHAKNCYFADFLSGSKRLYYPWDQDATITGHANGAYPNGSVYADLILAVPDFHDLYTQITIDLLTGPLAAARIIAFLDAVEPVLTDELAADPNNQIESVADHFDSLRLWISDRIEQIAQEIPFTTDVPLAQDSVILAQNFPNPFNPQTTIKCDLLKQTSVTLRIFDLAGRLVDVLVEGKTMPAGTHTATWTGRDSHGRAMPSGTYFYRLEAGGYVETKRMTLIR